MNIFKIDSSGWQRQTANYKDENIKKKVKKMGDIDFKSFSEKNSKQ